MRFQKRTRYTSREEFIFKQTINNHRNHSYFANLICYYNKKKETL